MSSEYTKAALDTFLEVMAKNHLVNPSTVAGWKAACGRILEDVQPGDDVRNLDIKTAVRRYNNKHPGELGLASLKEYERRIGRVLEEFGKYVASPTDYKGRGRSPTESGVQKKNNNATKKAVTGQNIKITPGAATLHAEGQTAAPARIAGLSLEFPMRPDFLAQVVVPRDMRAAEAKRFTQFIMTLAHDFEPDVKGGA